jgi:hypothetical protein
MASYSLTTRRLAGHELTKAGLAEPRRQEILRSHGTATDHRHA